MTSERLEIQVRNPRSGEADYSFIPADRAAVTEACSQLRAAGGAWAAASLDHRIGVLRGFAKSLEQNRQSLVEALVADTGRRAISIMEVDIIAPAIERWAEIAKSLEEDPTGRSSALPFIAYTITKRPYGLAGIISPWNFPLTLSIMDALPALLAGVAVIIKPSEVTPRFAAPRAFAPVWLCRHP